jgi:tryptophanyl-tRNA synthetase
MQIHSRVPMFGPADAPPVPAPGEVRGDRPDHDGKHDDGKHDDGKDHDGALDEAVSRAQAKSAVVEERLRLQPGNHLVLSGDRPTGDLHIGHLLGTLANRVRLQQLGVPLVLVIADYQVIVDRNDPGPVRDRVRALVADYLAAGVDPERTVIFPHSAIPSLNQLHRNPTIKSEMNAAGRPLSGLLLTYPVHQAADILFCGGTVVPVGMDQLPHLELTRSIARRFNDRYGHLFRLPEPLLSRTPLVLGTDGRKMSKSHGNSIALSANEDLTASRIRSAKTDSVRLIEYRPKARPEVASLLEIVAAFTGDTPAGIAHEIGNRGSGALKARAAEAVNEFLRPLRARRRELVAEPSYLDGVLLDGIGQANAMASSTLGKVRAAMDMDYLAGRRAGT